jgi:hypothetical protein
MKMIVRKKDETGWGGMRWDGMRAKKKDRKVP